ncbi:MAG: hypothetical protein EXQ69_03190 [Acidimicrobiia bacterium]|nr:hypothetical protein [Acidimicrobiia bacterium]
MARSRIPSNFLLTSGLLLLAAGTLVWLACHLLLNTERIVASSNEIIAVQPVRDVFAGRLAETLEPRTDQTPFEELVAARKLADEAVQTPQFALAFHGALRKIHAQVFHGDNSPIILDEALVTQSVIAAGGTPSTRVLVTVDKSVLPDASRSANSARGAIPLLLFAGLGLVTAAFLSSKRRALMLKRVGRWTLVAGIVTAAFFWLLPTAILFPSGGWIEVVGIFIATGDAVLLPALLLVGAGTASILIGKELEMSKRRRALSAKPRPRERHLSGWSSPV